MEESRRPEKKNDPKSFLNVIQLDSEDIDLIESYLAGATISRALVHAQVCRVDREAIIESKASDFFWRIGQVARSALSVICILVQTLR